MTYLFKNLHNPWVIIFFLLFLITVLIIICLFRMILRKPKAVFEEWRSGFEKEINFQNNYDVLEQMRHSASADFEKEEQTKSRIEKLIKFQMIFSAVFFVITLITLLFSLRIIPSVYIPKINNPAVIFIALSITIFILFTVSYLIGYRSFQSVKEKEIGEVKYRGTGSELQITLKQCVLEDTIHSRIKQMANGKRRSYFFRASLFGFTGFVLYLILIAGLTLSRYLWH